jgi:hypothetical protein
VGEIGPHYAEQALDSAARLPCQQPDPAVFFCRR